jgi:tetratricopeptide (TPR) repeat protein
MRLFISSVLAALVMAAPSAGAQNTAQYKARNGVQYRALADSGPIARAGAARAADPRNVDLILALGLAQAGMRQYREAISTFSDGLRVAPTNVLLYRWRGHRYISTGQYDRAVADLARGFALDTLNYDVLYHLGAAHFIRGEFGDAAMIFGRAQKLAPNPNEVAGATDWLWMSLSRAGRAADAQRALAPITDSLRITSATAYMQRLRLYRGVSTAEQVIASGDTTTVQRSTLAYGVGNWYLTRGDTATAKQWFTRAVEAGGWPAFGFLAAEQELKRLR